MNTANKLTLLRIILIPVFLLVLYLDFPGCNWVALGIFIVASLTDMLDGYVARHYNQITDMGKFMDPLADKMLVLSAMCWFVERGRMAGWILAIVLLREFGVSGLRLVERQGQDRRHNGLPLPHAGLPPGLAGSHMRAADRGDDAVLRGGILYKK